MTIIKDGTSGITDSCYRARPISARSTVPEVLKYSPSDFISSLDALSVSL